jgi:hypothetical protein
MGGLIRPGVNLMYQTWNISASTLRNDTNHNCKPHNASIVANSAIEHRNADKRTKHVENAVRITPQRRNVKDR